MANTTVFKRSSAEYRDIPLAAGAVSIGVGDNISFGADGFAKVSSNTSGEAFAGVSEEAKEIPAAENAVAGTFTVRVIAARSVNEVKRTIAATRATALPGKEVYVADAKGVRFYADSGGQTPTPTTFVKAGVISEFVSNNECWIKI
jgi:hypothetical protein